MKLSASPAPARSFGSSSAAATSGMTSTARTPRIAAAFSAALRRAGSAPASCNAVRIAGSAAEPRCSSAAVADSTSFGDPPLQIVEPSILVAEDDADVRRGGLGPVIPHGGGDTRDQRDEKREEAPHLTILSEGFAPRTPHALSLTASPARSDRVAHSLRSFAAVSYRYFASASNSVAFVIGFSSVPSTCNCSPYRSSTAARAHRDDRRVFERGHVAQVVHERQAVDALHHDVEQDDGRLQAVAQLLERLQPVRHGLDAESHLLGQNIDERGERTGRRRRRRSNAGISHVRRGSRARTVARPLRGEA